MNISLLLAICSFVGGVCALTNSIEKTKSKSRIILETVTGISVSLGAIEYLGILDRPLICIATSACLGQSVNIVIPRIQKILDSMLNKG